MDYQWHDLLGNAGVAIIIGTYLLLQMGRLQATRLSYSLLNAAGAALVLVSLSFDFNLSAFVIEVFWVLISGLGAFRTLRRRRAGPPTPQDGAAAPQAGRRAGSSTAGGDAGPVRPGAASAGQ